MRVKNHVSGKKNLKFVKTNFKLCDLTKLPFENNYFDFGYSLGVLHHIPDINKALTEIHRILKPNAGFIVYVLFIRK